MTQASILGANDRIRLGFLGVANRGGQLISAFTPHKDMEIAAICDVQGSTLEKVKARLDGKPDAYKDFRHVLERDDIDAVVIATPDHWHAIQTVDACDAGKDVYVEKPLAITVHEGRRMVAAARRNKRVVTVGLHRRSSTLYAKAAELVQSGGIGPVSISRGYHRSNLFPAGIGKQEPVDPPADLDWDMWLGPRPKRPFQTNLAPYKFRWWKLYSSQTSNNGVHFLDCIRWITGDRAPTSVCAMGGNFAVDDDRTIPDVLHVSYEFPSGRMLTFGMYETGGNRTLARAGYFEIRGAKGAMYCGDKSFEVLPERGGQFATPGARMEAMTVDGNEGNHTTLHARNFLDCMRSRDTPNADVEEGHRSTTMSLLAKISHATQSRLEWDAETEQITNSAEANAMLHYEYRAPWKLG